MPSRYHPIEDGLWDNRKFDAHGNLPEAPFEERAFFVYLVSNPRQRPAGLYRATDDQLSSGSRLPVARVRKLLASLADRRLIVRDGWWVFLPGYLERQARGPRLLAGAESDISACDSHIICKAFVEKYPLYSKWVPDRLLTGDNSSGDLARARASEHPTPPHPTPNIKVGETPTAWMNGFDELWALHPGPKGPKEEARKAYCQAKPPVEAVEAMRAQLAYKAACEKAGAFCPQVPHLHRWIKKRRWEDEIPASPGTHEDEPAQVVKDPKAMWNTKAEYQAARKAGRVHPSHRVPEWETSNTPST